LEDTPIRTQINVVANLFGGIVATIFAIAIVIISRAPTKLVNIKNYNLGTISGQVDFANTVQSSYVNPRVSIIIGIFASILAIYSFAMVIRSVRLSKFPPSVIALLMDDNGPDQGVFSGGR
jgi:ammonia channel protein AmtB